jgi:iron complex outermembrane receptor protein
LSWFFGPGKLTLDKTNQTMQKILVLALLLIPVLAFTQNDSAVRTNDSARRAALYLEPVEIRATRAAENAPFTKTTLTGAELRQQNLGQDLPFLLNQTPSVVINSDAGNGVGYTGLRIRGSDATRINMTINGIPYNDAESQGLFFVNLPDIASSLKDIQIQRGIGTSSNGAGAFGATMNFSTNEANLDSYAEINNSVGSYNTWKHTIRSGSGLINDHFTIDARLSKISSDGYVDRASSDLSSFYVSGAYTANKSSVRMNVFSGKEKTYQAWNGIPQRDLETNRRVNYSGTEKPGIPYENETDNYQQDHYQLFFNHRFSDQIDFNTAFFLTEGRGYYENYKAAQSFGDYGLANFTVGNDTLTETDLVRQLWLDNKYYGQIISMQYKHNRGTFTAGGGWNKYEGNHFGEIPWAAAGVPVNHRWYDLDATKTDVNGYAKYLYRVATGLELFGDVQYRNVTYYIGGFRNNPDLIIDNNYHFVNPKFGVTYSANKFRYYASYSQASKEPNRDDFEAGVTQQPLSEKMHDIEAGIEHRNRTYSWAANIYYMKYKDQLVLTGKINDVGAYARVNIPDSYRAGIELQGSINIASWLHIDGNFTWSSNKVKNFTEYFDDYDAGGQKTIFHKNADISFSPDAVAGATLDFMPFENASVRLISKYVSRQYLDNTSNRERSIDPYFVQDLRLTYNLKKVLFKSTSFVLQVNNLLNTRYESNGYTFSYIYEGATVTENYYFPMAPTNVMFGINISL